MKERDQFQGINADKTTIEDSGKVIGCDENQVEGIENDLQNTTITRMIPRGWLLIKAYIPMQMA